MGIEKLKNNLEVLLSKENIQQDDLELIFVRIRVVIEKLSLKAKYAHLNFYCDWVVHSEINRPTKVIDLLFELNKKILIDLDKGIQLNISELIKPEQCRKELDEFLSEIFKSRKYRLTDENWESLLYLLFHILSNRPLRLPEIIPKGYLEKVNKIKSFATMGGEIIGINSLEIEISEGTATIPKGSIIWIAHATGSRNLRIIGQL